MKISIALTTYNGSLYLKAQLESILSQTRLPDEIIICDDGSTDDTLSKINEFMKIAPFAVNLYRNEKNLGYSQNFNKAISLTTGDIIFFCDQDDVWLDSKIETVCKIADDHNEYMAFVNDANLVDGDLNSYELSTMSQYLSYGGKPKEFKLGCCCAIRRSLADACIPMPSSIVGHEEWFIGIAELLERKLFIEATLQLYRRHCSNISNSPVSHPKKLTGIEFFKFKSMELYGIIFHRSPSNSNNYITIFDNLQKVASKLDLNNSKKLIIAYNNNKKKLDFEKFRRILRSYSRSQRIIPILRAYFYGRYKTVSGFKSAVIDFIR